MNEKVDIEVFKRRLTVEMEGLTPIEIGELARQVHEKMSEMAARHPNIADSSKLAILTALALSADLYHLKQAKSTDERALENKLEKITHTLRAALASTDPS